MHAYKGKYKKKNREVKVKKFVYRIKNFFSEKIKSKKTLPHGIEPWTYRLTADRSAD